MELLLTQCLALMAMGSEGGETVFYNLTQFLASVSVDYYSIVWRMHQTVLSIPVL